MGQVEVFNWLLKQRLFNDHSFFCVKQVREGLEKENMPFNNVRVWCNRLRGSGFLEVTESFPKRFRLKRKLLKVYGNGSKSLKHLEGLKNGVK